MKKDNPDKLATQVHKTQDKINVREYGRVNDKRKSKETGNIGYTRDKTNTCQITEGVMKKDNPEKLATLETQDIGQINVREYRRGNEKGQSRKSWQHRAHKTQDK